MLTLSYMLTQIMVLFTSNFLFIAWNKIYCFWARKEISRIDTKGLR